VADRPSAKPRKKRDETRPDLQGTSTRKCQCPWTATLPRQFDSCWLLQIVTNFHNHGPHSVRQPILPSLQISNLLAHETKIRRITNTKGSSRSIAAFLRTEGARCTPRDVYNFGYKIRSEYLGDLTPIQWLMDELQRQDFYFTKDVDPATNRSRRLFYMEVLNLL